MSTGSDTITIEKDVDRIARAMAANVLYEMWKLSMRGDGTSSTPTMSVNVSSNAFLKKMNELNVPPDLRKGNLAILNVLTDQALLKTVAEQASLEKTEKKGTPSSVPSAVMTGPARVATKTLTITNTDGSIATLQVYVNDQDKLIVNTAEHLIDDQSTEITHDGKSIRYDGTQFTQSPGNGQLPVIINAIVSGGQRRRNNALRTARKHRQSQSSNSSIRTARRRY